MYVGIKFFNMKANAYAGMQYTYTTNLPLVVGDLVCCPTPKDEGARAIVTAVDLPAPSFRCKEITRRYTTEV